MGFAFALSPGANGGPVQDAEHPAGLLVCTNCGSPLMHPIDCEEHGHDRWYLELRCPECESVRPGLFDLDMLNELDSELDLAEAEIKADLARLTNANMLEFVTRFVSALNADAIHPLDFST